VYILNLYVNGFYNLINNYIFYWANGNVIDNNDVYDYTQANANLFGGEAGIHFHPHPLDWLHILSSFESVSKKGMVKTFLNLPANRFMNTLRTNFILVHFKERRNGWCRTYIKTK
jgi:iron complex outermembrane receptor protein